MGGERSRGAVECWGMQAGLVKAFGGWSLTDCLSYNELIRLTPLVCPESAHSAPAMVPTGTTGPSSVLEEFSSGIRCRVRARLPSLTVASFVCFSWS